MAQIQKGTNYTTGDTVTAANLNTLVDGAALLPGVITDQTAKAVPLGADTVLLYSAADTALRKTTLTQIGANLTVANATLAATATNATNAMDATLAANATKLATPRNIALTGSVTGNVNFDGSADVSITTSGGGTITGVSDQANSSTGYLDVPSGTTAQRPASPTSGNIRYNSTLAAFEFYDGTSWSSPSTVKMMDVLIAAGGGGGAGGGYSNQAGGGGGGCITTNIAYATSVVTVGAGGGAGSNGGNSTAFTMTASGGGCANYSAAGSSGGCGGGSYTGTNGGSGISGQGFSGATQFQSGGGGGAGSPGAGNNGGGGRIWVNRKEYCSGGGGSQFSPSPTGLYGNGGRSNGSGTAGVVIIRYYGAATGTGGTITSGDGYTYHTFTAGGTFTAA